MKRLLLLVALVFSLVVLTTTNVTAYYISGSPYFGYAYSAGGYPPYDGHDYYGPGGWNSYSRMPGVGWYAYGAYSAYPVTSYGYYGGYYSGHYGAYGSYSPYYYQYNIPYYASYWPYTYRVYNRW